MCHFRRGWLVCRLFRLWVLVLLAIPLAHAADQHNRARDLGIPLDGTPGRYNAITDVAGVEVGHTTLISGEARLAPSKDPIRTGVTAILPRGKESCEPVFAGWFALNGHGEMTGTTWVEQSGLLRGPVMITDTGSIGIVHDAVTDWADKFDHCGLLPVVAETYSVLSGSHVTKEHTLAALNGARSGPVPEGNVGGGTGMVCHRFKGGIGTASRVLPEQAGKYTIGVLVQCNYGDRHNLRIAGVPVGAEMPKPAVCFDTPEPPPGRLGDFYGTCDGGQSSQPEDRGSIIIVVATDAPLLPHQLKRVAKRPALALGRMGAIGGNGSGDIFIAFSTANPLYASQPQASNLSVTMLEDYETDLIYEATVQATEEAIINSMLAAETMTGVDRLRAPAIPHDRLREVMKEYNRIDESAGQPTAGSRN